MELKRISTDITFFEAERNSGLPKIRIVTESDAEKILYYVWFFFVANQMLYTISLLPDRDDLFFIPVSKIKTAEIIDKENNALTINFDLQKGSEL